MNVVSYIPSLPNGIVTKWIHCIINVGRLHDRSCCRLKISDADHHERVPYGLAVRIPGFHPGGPGSTPGMGTSLFLVFKIPPILPWSIVNGIYTACAYLIVGCLFWSNTLVATFTHRPLGVSWSPVYTGNLIHDGKMNWGCVWLRKTGQTTIVVVLHVMLILFKDTKWGDNSD